MEFEVFNPTTEKKYRTQNAKLTIDLDNQRIRITKYTVEEMKLKDGDFLHFLRFGSAWFLSKCAGGGFRLSVDDENRSGGTFYASTTARMIVKDLAKSRTKSEYYLTPTQHEYNSFPVYELLLIPKAA